MSSSHRALLRISAPVVGTLVTALVTAGAAQAAKPLKITFKRDAKGTCTSSHPLQSGVSSCATVAIRVRPRPGEVPVIHRFARVRGCAQVDAMVRTFPVRYTGQDDPSFADPGGGSGARGRSYLSEHLDDDAERREASGAPLKLSIQPFYRQCAGLKSAKLTFIFPTIDVKGRPRTPARATG